MKKVTIKQLREETEREFGESYARMLESVNNGFESCEVGEWAIYKCDQCGGSIACEVYEPGLIPSLQACPDCGDLSLTVQALVPYQCIDTRERTGQLCRPTLKQMALFTEEVKQRTCIGFLMISDYMNITRQVFLGGMETQLWRTWHKGDEECENLEERVLFQVDLTGDFRIGTRTDVDGVIFFISQGLWYNAQSVRNWAYLHDLMPAEMYESRYDRYDGETKK